VNFREPERRAVFPPTSALECDLLTRRVEDEQDAEDERRCPGCGRQDDECYDRRVLPPDHLTEGGLVVGVGAIDRHVISIDISHAPP
jgi:hypothetical protein